MNASRPRKALLKSSGLRISVLQKVWNTDGVYFAQFAYLYKSGGVPSPSSNEIVVVGVSADSRRICYYDAYSYYRYRTGETISAGEILN